jgi:hypothetical protein
MAPVGRNIESNDGKWSRKVNDLSHIPAPSEAEWVGEWHFFKGCCSDHDDWVRYFGGRSWIVEMSSSDPVEVDIAGIQFSDGCIDNWIGLDGDILGLNADEALILAGTLSQAADELERIQGDSL